MRTPDGDFTYTGNVEVDDLLEDKLTVEEVIKDIPTENALHLASALLFSVYGWGPDKVGKMHLASLRRWVKLAKKKMTWENAYMLRRIIRGKKKSLWQKILKIKS